MNISTYCRCLLVLMLLALGINVSAQQQTNDGQRILAYIQKVMNYNRTIPQEKVYMHFDNTGYFEGETMWFKAYVTKSPLAADASVKPTDMSKVLYVELLNPSGDVIKTQKYHIDEKGQAFGDMKLDTLYGSGFYEVRAYTRYMTNWGVDACFSRVFPVFQGADIANGDYSNMTIKRTLYRQRDPNNRGGDTDSLYAMAIENGVFTNNNFSRKINVHFYPEGGDLVEGLSSRVAIMAVDDTGRGFCGEGKVVNEKGETVAAVKTDSLGRGLFKIGNASMGMKLQMGNVKGKVQTFNLPNPKAEGCALNFDAVSDEMLVKLQATQGVSSSLIGYAVMNNGNITFCDTMVAVPLAEIELDRQSMKEGVNQFTVFDSNGQILAERLFFICPKANENEDIIITSKTNYLKPCGKIELDVKTQPNSTFSFSAIDLGTATGGKHGNMKTWMLLGSDVKGYIHNIDYYFEADDAEHRLQSDLLMLTQGWRRYNWEMMTGHKAFEKVQPIEDKFYIYGKLQEYRSHNKVGNVELETFLYNESGESLNGTTITDEEGNYAFEMPFVDGEWKMQIFTRVNDKRKTYCVGIDRQFSPTPRFVTPLEASISVHDNPNIFVKNIGDPEPEEEFIPITRKDHVLQNVTVKAKRRYFTNDDFRYKNESFGRQYATLFYNIDKELDAIRDLGEKDPTLIELLCKKNSMFNYSDFKDLPYPPCGEDSMWRGHLSYGHRPIKWIVDNGERQMKLNSSYDTAIQRILGRKPTYDNPMDSSYIYAAITSDGGATGDEFFPTWPDEVRTAYIVPSSSEEEEQCVRIYLYMRHRYTTESNKGLRKTFFQGFNKPSTFKMEDYSDIPPMPDFRRTIYWNPNVTTDAEGRAKIDFFNNSTCQDMFISAEGMTNDGQVIMNK